MSTCPQCRRPFKSRTLFTREQVRIPMPPKGVMHMLLSLELMYTAATKDALCGADVPLIAEAKVEFSKALVARWPQLCILIWKAIGRGPVIAKAT